MAANLQAVLVAVLMGAVGTKRTAAEFVHPPPWIPGLQNPLQDNPRYVWGSNVAVEWKDSSGDDSDLVFGLYYPRKLSDPNHDALYFVKTSIPSSTTTFTWNATVLGEEGLVPSGSDAICYLLLMLVNSGSVKFSSSYFNVSLPPQATSPTSASSAFPTTTTTTTLSGTTAVPSSTTTPSATSEPASSGLSHGAAAGIGVGVTLGCILVLGGLGFMWWRRRKSRREANSTAENWQQQPRLEEPSQQESGPVLGLEGQDSQGFGGMDKRSTIISELDGGQSSIVHEKP